MQSWHVELLESFQADSCILKMRFFKQRGLVRKIVSAGDYLLDIKGASS